MFYILTILLIAAADQILKCLVIHWIGMFQELPVIDHFFYLHCIQNHGIAMGMFAGFRSIVLILTVVLLVAAVSYIFIRRRMESRNILLSLSFIVGGGLGNLVDRFRLGYVVDFLDFRIWPYIFNVADIFVVAGCFFFMLFLLTGRGNQAHHE